MENAIILLHEEALRLSHPVFAAAPKNSRLIYIWDEDLLKQSGYSFKRLVFIYETLCTLAVEIIKGNTEEVIHQLAPESLFVPAIQHLPLKKVIERMSENLSVQMIAEESFVAINSTQDFRRFFQFWKQAEKSVFLVNGGVDATRN